jgi:hypothetical protein
MQNRLGFNISHLSPAPRSPASKTGRLIPLRANCLVDAMYLGLGAYSTMETDIMSGPKVGSGVKVGLDSLDRVQSGVKYELGPTTVHFLKVQILQ